MKKELILIGGGGHCKSCIDVIESEGKYQIVGIVDIKSKVGSKILGYPIIGTDEDLDELSKKYNYFFITLGHIKKPDLRIKLYNKIKSLNKKLPAIVSPNAYVSKSAIFSEGTIIMHGAIINADSTIGVNSIINSNALIEHDVIINNHCHISTSSTINGNCTIDDNVFIGSRSVIIQSINITKNSIVGAGSVVISDITESGTYIGNPAKKLRK